MRLSSRPDSSAGEKVVPGGSPDDLDDIPAGAAKNALQFLDDFAVAAHRAVEALQIAVDNPGQVVQPLPRRQSQRAERFRLVGFAVAHEGPDARLLLASGAGRAP